MVDARFTTLDEQNTPSPLPFAAEAAVAEALAVEAGAYLLEVFGHVTGHRKADGTLVTEADFESSRRISEGLRQRFPGDEIISEEDGHHYRGSGRVWVLDPLDGTGNYVHRVPLWGVTMALVVDGRPVVGVSHFPTLGFTETAVRGGGTWTGDRRLATSADAPDQLDANDLVAHCSRTLGRYDLSLPAKGRMLGSAALNYALVAAGSVRAAIEQSARLWDLAAGWLLVEEAGGHVDLLIGDPLWPLAAADYGRRSYSTLSAGSLTLFNAARQGVKVR